MFAFLLACSGSSPIQTDAPSEVDDTLDDTDTLAADVSCPAAAGLVETLAGERVAE